MIWGGPDTAVGVQGKAAGGSTGTCTTAGSTASAGPGSTAQAATGSGMPSDCLLPAMMQVVCLVTLRCQHSGTTVMRFFPLDALLLGFPVWIWVCGKVIGCSTCSMLAYPGASCTRMLLVQCSRITTHVSSPSVWSLFSLVTLRSVCTVCAAASAPCACYAKAAFDRVPCAVCLVMKSCPLQSE